MEPTRRHFLKTGLQSMAMMPLLQNQNIQASSSTKNILLIMADDLGIECLQSYSGKSYNTPNLNKLAQTGMQFQHAYSCPVCSPSRVCILTGRYTFRSGTGTSDAWGTIPSDEITFGHILWPHYMTALAGKWQLTLLKDNPHHVQDMGFDKSACWAWHEGSRFFKPMIYYNDEPKTGADHEYGPNLFTDYLIEFIEQNQSRNFLAYYPMVLTHFPKTSGPYKEPPGPNGHLSYTEMVEKMDDLIGRLVDTLDRLNLREDTIIMFTSDNGTPGRVTSQWKGQSIQGGKGELTDAGTHVPLIANCPGTIPAGSKTNALVDFSDFLPTFAEIASHRPFSENQPIDLKYSRARLTEITGKTYPENRIIDGVSFLPVLEGKKESHRDWVYTEWNGKRWIRTQRYKLYGNGDFFDIQNDPNEKSPIVKDDLSNEQKQIYQKLKSELFYLLASASN